MMEKNKPKTNILLKILWCAGIISCILMILPVILQTEGAINLLFLPAMLYFFLSPAWFAEKGQAEYGKGNRDRDNIFYPCGHIVPNTLRRDEYMRYIFFLGMEFLEK